MDSILDALNSIVESAPGAILDSNSNLSENKKTDYKTKVSGVSSRPLWGVPSNQEDSENTWGSSWSKGSTNSGYNSAWDSNCWDNNNNNNNSNIVNSRGNNNNDNGGWGNNNNDINNSWGNNNDDGSSGWGKENNYERNYSTTEYTDDRGYQNYQNVNKVNDVSGPNNVDLYTNNVNNNFVDLYTNNEYDNNQTGGWPQQQQQQQQQQHSYYESKGESPSPSESETLTENSETVDIKSKISAWHSLTDPNAKEREDGIGGGQLHRRGKNFIPLAEEKVLAIQQKGGGSKRGGKRVIALPTKSIGKPPIKPSQKSVAPLKPDTSQKPPAQKVSNKIAPAPVKTSVPPQNQKQNTPPPSRTQQTQLPPTPPLSQSSQSLQRQGPSRDVPIVPLPSQIQPPQQPPQQPSQKQQQPPPQQPQPQRPQQTQQSQQSQQTKQPQWGSSQLVNEPFWETTPSSPPPQNKQSKQYANEMITSQSQPIRHQSSHPTKPVQDYSVLPYIPPEFDSAPYRKQLSPPPPPPMSNGYNNNEWDDKNYDSNVEYQRNEYYDEEESDFEKQDNKTNHIYRREEPQVDHNDRGEILLTINVELEEGKDGKEGKTQAIEVRVNDRPIDLAKEFCNKWRVNNPVVMPALESLIREEKEKRLGVN